MSNYSGVTLGNLDDIFSVQPKVITDVYVSKLHPFKDHPFRVEDDEAMQMPGIGNRIPAARSLLDYGLRLTEFNDILRELNGEGE